MTSRYLARKDFVNGASAGLLVAPGLVPASRRYHVDVYSVHKSGYDLEAMRTVAAAYRGERQARRLDEPARDAAIKAFHARYPALNRAAASEAVAQIIPWAAQEHPVWFWKGVGLPERGLVS